jgi:flagellar assembly factor FliW
MIIHFAHFGIHEIDPENILTFPLGIAGFDNLTRYKLCHEDKEQPIVYWLQAVDDQNVAFSLVDPTLFGLHYEFNLTDNDVALLRVESVNDISVMLIAYKLISNTACEDSVRANINGPVIINSQTRLGLQKVLVERKANITLKSKQTT